jgi:polysaccharide export outer membrane protein
MISPSAKLRRQVALFGLAVIVGASGRPAFAQAQPESVAPADEATVQSARTYRIRQGDQITLTVFGEPTLTPPGPLRVVQGGTIALPLVGEVSVAGLTTAQASSAVAQKLHRYLRSPQVTVAIYTVGPVEALVLGNVKVPGKYTLPPPARVTDAIAAAGGLGPVDGDFPDARLEAPEGTTKSVSLQKLLHDGDESQNVAIESGETVYVPSPSVFNVVVTGAVDKPGDVALHEGDDVAMAVARAGASSAQKPDLNRVTVTRTQGDGKIMRQTINLYPILQNGDLSHDLKLQKGDLVFVPQAGPKMNILDPLYLLRFLVP